ncbi:hypothetical protein VU11_07640, partial [Desulfobulbus sp. US2]|nr:hypothetical protein [Desulfobulbus sp. US2]
QDLTAYGDDFDDLEAGHNLISLLKKLLAETDIPWFRLLYLYPSSVSSELLELMAEQLVSFPTWIFLFSMSVIRSCKRWGVVTGNRIWSSSSP